MATANTATFHPFPRLSSELRTRIWELTFQPRIVEVRVVKLPPPPVTVQMFGPGSEKVVYHEEPLVRHLRSSTVAPAQLHTCREAREHLTTHHDDRYRYEKGFSDIFTKTFEETSQEKRYVWLNFTIDMVSIGDTELREFEAVAHQIRRLRLQRSLWEETFARFESRALCQSFKNLTEVHLICMNGINLAYQLTEEVNFPCPPENVYVVDLEEMGGTTMRSLDLDAMVDKEDLEKYGPREED